MELKNHQSCNTTIPKVCQGNSKFNVKSCYKLHWSILFSNYCILVHILLCSNFLMLLINFTVWYSDSILCIRYKIFYFIRVLFHRQRRFTGQQRKEGDHVLFHSTTSSRSQTLRHIFPTLHVRSSSRIFNCNSCVYQTATWWDLPPYRITIWLIG